MICRMLVKNLYVLQNLNMMLLHNDPITREYAKIVNLGVIVGQTLVHCFFFETISIWATHAAYYEDRKLFGVIIWICVFLYKVIS
jgi:hypothetical protein